MSMQECIELTLKNNLELSQAGITPQIRRAQVIQEESVFDPTINLELSKNSDENLSPTRLAGANVSRQENIFANVGLEKKLTNGATLELEFNNQEFRSNSSFATLNPYYKSNLGLKLTQPLLENFGTEVNEAKITIAVNNRSISLLQLKQKIIDIVSQAQSTYWEVVYSRENLKVKQLLLKQAQDLLEQNRVKVELGMLLPLEVLEAESSVAARQEEVIVAQDQLTDAEDKLKKVTNLVRQDWQVKITPTDKPSIAAISPGLEECVQTALISRPDYMLLQKDLLNQKINLRLAENQRLPDLNLIGEWGLNSLGSSYGNNLERLENADYNYWMVGVELKIPWGNRLANSNHLQQKLALKQIILGQKDLAHQITLEVREAVRQLQTDLKRIQATKIAQQLEEKKLATEEERFNLGLSTSHDVLEYQTTLARARINHLKAIIDYNNSFIDLEVRKGTLLEKNGIRIESLSQNT